MNSQKTKSINNFNPKKNKLKIGTIIVAILMFVTGGGYFVFRSFAATGPAELDYRMYKIRVQNVQPSAGHIGIDTYWGDDSYNPCHHLSVEGNEYCEVPGGEVQYHKIYRYGWDYGTDSRLDREGAITTKANKAWPKKVTQSMEIYSTPESVGGQKNSYGNLRIEVSKWRRVDVPAYGITVYESLANLGTINLPSADDGKSGRMDLYAYYNGQRAGNRMSVDAYGQTMSRAYSSLNYPAYGYFSGSSEGDGRVYTSPLVSGRQRMFVSDRVDGMSWECNYDINSGETLSKNFDFTNKANLGDMACQRMDNPVGHLSRVGTDSSNTPGSSIAPVPSAPENPSIAPAPTPEPSTPAAPAK